MPRRDQRILLGLAALTVLLAVLQSATGISGDVLLATPRRRPVAARAARPRRAPRVLARGGRLIAVALAQRGPPRAALAL